jgi:hypothetical protein
LCINIYGDIILLTLIYFCVSASFKCISSGTGSSTSYSGPSTSHSGPVEMLPYATRGLSMLTSSFEPSVSFEDRTMSGATFLSRSTMAPPSFSVDENDQEPRDTEEDQLSERDENMSTEAYHAPSFLQHQKPTSNIVMIAICFNKLK